MNDPALHLPKMLRTYFLSVPLMRHEQVVILALEFKYIWVPLTDSREETGMDECMYGWIQG